MAPSLGGFAGAVAAVALTAACLDAPPSATAPGEDAGESEMPVGRLGGSYNALCAIQSGGALFCWGAGNGGQLGDGLATDSGSPVAVLDGAGEPLTGVLAVTTGINHGCAVMADRSVACWGSNGNGQLGDDGTTTRLRAETRVIGVEDAAQVSAYGPHTCALDRAGAVWCWGRNDHGELGEGGTVEEWRTAVAMRDEAATITDAVAISAGFHHTCAVRSGERVWCTGLNDTAQLGRYPGEPFECTRDLPRALEIADDDYLVGASQVAGGVAHSCALVGETVFCWGDPRCGQLGDGVTDAPCVARTPTSCDEESWSAPVVVTLDEVAPCEPVQIGAGEDYACALCGEGHIACWGSGALGQLGDGQAATGPTPVRVEGIERAVELAVATATACARLDNDEVHCWGAGSEGQLGNGTIGEGVFSATPVRVMGLPP